MQVYSLSTGDAVYLSGSTEEHVQIVRIDKLWKNTTYVLFLLSFILNFHFLFLDAKL